MAEQVKQDLNEVIQPYLPRLVLRWASEAPDDQLLELDASVAFVDISGFTRLSERLARSGKVGAEELSDAINVCFTRLLSVAYGNGGGLIKFGGDALLLLFTGVDHQAKACRAAAGMRRALREIGSLKTPGGRVALRMSVGVHSGVFSFFLVGDTHRELIVAGPSASRTVEMESTAEAGEIVVSEATASALPTGVLGSRKGTGWLLRREPTGLTPERIESEPDCSSDLMEFIPASIRSHLAAAFSEPEHRRVTVAFVHFDGIDDLIEREGTRAVARELAVLVGDVQRAVERYGVSFLGSDIDRDGGKIILAAGAPFASGNDEERMLLALRDVIDGEHRLPVRIGVNTGYVFAGDIGPSYRRTYTVMGDAVNLAARVMAKAAPGQILTTAAVLDGSRTSFETHGLDPFFVKGKSQPVNAYEVGKVVRGKGAEADGSVPLIGRDEEMSILQAALESSRDHLGRLVEVIAEPGMGKSRLIEELRSRAIEETKLAVACELYESSTPYFPFRGLLRSLLGIPERATDHEASARLHEVLLALTPHLAPLAPLMAIVMGIEMPETDETRQLEERFRRARLNEVVQELLARLLRGPTLFTFEDGHWMDEPSADLLGYLASRLRGLPWLICVTRRDVEDGFHAPQGPSTQSIRLQALSAGAAAELVAAETGDSPFAPHQISAMAERSGGNPLFLKELLSAARLSGIETLPDSIETLIMAKIDRLAPSDRNLLRRASVLGRSFARDFLSAVLEEVPPPDERVWQRLSEFIKAENGTMSFVHALIRDGAYEGLPYRLRRTLHSQVGDTIERSLRGQTPDDYAELLSMHFFHAQRFMEAWRYSLAAAERAKMSYAYVEAADFYERALDAARHIPDIEKLETARIREALGDVRERMGAYLEAEKAYKIVRRMVKGDPLAEARLQLKLSLVEGWLRRGRSRALASITKGLRILREMRSKEASAARAQLMVAYAQFSQEGGRHADAIKWSRRAIEEAQKAGEKQALADAYRQLDLANISLGKVELATYSRKALVLYEELGDLRGQAWVLNNLGSFDYWKGRWDDAVGLYQRAQKIQEKIGDVVAAGFGTANIAEILTMRGQLEEAEGLLRSALRVFQSEGLRPRVAYVKSHLGVVAARLKRFDEALGLLNEAREELMDTGAETDARETDARIAECHLLNGDPDLALGLAEAALDRASTLGGVSPEVPMLCRVRGYALMQLSRLEEAKSALDESLHAGRLRNADYEIALTLRALGQLDEVMQGSFPETSRVESEEIIRRLGIISLPAIPLLPVTTS